MEVTGHWCDGEPEERENFGVGPEGSWALARSLGAQDE